MRFIFLIALMVLLGLTSGCQHTASAYRAGNSVPLAERFTEVSNGWFKEMLTYIYRWHFDESYILVPDRGKGLELWIRPVQQELDLGDNSKFLEIWLPGVQMVVEAKKADYRITEMDLVVKDDQYKVKSVRRMPEPPAPRNAYAIRHFEHEDITRYLFESSRESIQLSEEMRTRLSRVFAEFMGEILPDVATQDQVFYSSPISNVSNDLWVFWENQKLLLQYSSDMDLSNPGYWANTTLNLEVFDLDEDVVTSFDEVPGSNAYVTKDWVGRALYNCIVLGQKRVVDTQTANERLRTLRNGGKEQPAR